MNIDDLVKEIRSVSSEKVVQGLVDLLRKWKKSDETVEDLNITIERYLGNSWIKKGEDHNRIYCLWSSFRDQAIAGIAGMTMNERLYWFGLFGEFDSCPDQEAKLKIYKKLMASP